MKSQVTDRALDAAPERRRAVECSSPAAGSLLFLENELKSLVWKMRETAKMMRAHKSAAEPIEEHAAELDGAATIAESWIDGLRQANKLLVHFSDNIERQSRSQQRGPPMP